MPRINFAAIKSYTFYPEKCLSFAPPSVGPSESWSYFYVRLQKPR